MSRFPAQRLDRTTYPSVVELPIFYNDLDTNSHLNNVAIGRFFEQARVQHHADAGVWPNTHGARILVARVAVDYVDEGRYGTPLTVLTRTGRLGTTSFLIEQVAFQDDRLIGLAETTIVLTVQGRPAPLPPALREGLLPGGG